MVGHGGLPQDCPPELVAKFKRLEGARRDRNLPASAEEIEVDRTIRMWPRTAESDPYQAGLESLAESLRPFLKDRTLSIAYNEFCTPTIVAAAEDQIGKGITDITVVTTMLTPGGSHSEIEIPEEVEKIKQKFPEVKVEYAWPFDLSKVAGMLQEQIETVQR